MIPDWWLGMLKAEVQADLRGRKVTKLHNPVLRLIGELRTARGQCRHCGLKRGHRKECVTRRAA